MLSLIQNKKTPDVKTRGTSGTWVTIPLKKEQVKQEIQQEQVKPVEVVEQKKPDPIQKKIVKAKKPRETWKQSYKLLQSKHYSKKYQIGLQYLDDNGKKKKKTIRFGHKLKEDYVDNGDESIKLLNSNKLNNCQDLFHPNHWKLHILNNTSDIKQNYLQYINTCC